MIDDSFSNSAYIHGRSGTPWFYLLLGFPVIGLLWSRPLYKPLA